MNDRLFSSVIARYLPTLVGLVIGINCFAQNLPDLSKAMDSLFFKEDGTERPGYCISIVKDNAIVYQRSIGQINVEKSIPFTENSTFAIASCTKQFTGFSILMLEQAGKLKIEDDIRKHIPELPDFGHTIRLKHLLSHTSGIRDHLVLLNWENKQWSKDYTFKGTIRGLNKYPGLSFVPGENFAYSNTGFVLLAMVIERVSGQRVEDFMKERIFDPLGMNDTKLTFKRDYRNIGFSRPYNYNWDTKQFKTYRLKEVNALGAVGIYTTMNDYIKWDQNFSTKTVGNASLFERFLQSDTLNNGMSINYNNGLKQRFVKGYHVVEHSGGWAFYNFQHTRIPELGLSVIIASNNEFDYPIGMAETFLKEVLPDARIAKIYTSRPTKHEIKFGKYLSDNFILRKIEPKGNTLKISGPHLYGAKSYQLAQTNNLNYIDTTRNELIPTQSTSFRWAGGYYFNVPFEFRLHDTTSTNLESLQGKFENSELGRIKIRYNKKKQTIKIKTSFGKNPEIEEIIGRYFNLSSVDYDLLIKDENTLVIGSSLVFNLVFQRK